MTDVDESASASLAAELRHVTQGRIISGAAAAVATRGFAATTDDVAAHAGVSRRTVFRYFDGHEALLVAAVGAMILAYEAELPTGEPPDPDDVESWLRDVLGRLHHANDAVLGRAFWDFHVVDEDESPDLAAAISVVLTDRRQWARTVVDGAWRAQSDGEAPEWIVELCLVVGSAFGSNALRASGLSPDEGVDVAVRALLAAIDSARRSR